MKDIRGNEIKIGDTVAYAPGGSYAGIKIGTVVKINTKMISIAGEHNGRHMHSKTYPAYASQVLIINQLT